MSKTRRYIPTPPAPDAPKPYDQLFIIDRADEQSVQHAKDYPTGYLRNDVILVNIMTDCPTCYCHTKNVQKAVYVTRNGFYGDLEVMDWLTTTELEEVHRIAACMRLNAQNIPETARYIHSDPLPSTFDAVVGLRD